MVYVLNVTQFVFFSISECLPDNLRDKGSGQRLSGGLRSVRIWMMRIGSDMKCVCM